MSPARVVTLGEVARLANVSRATVSRALHNHPALPAETCQRIQEIARRVGYRINPVVSTVMAGLRQPKSSTLLGVLGFITADPTRGGWRQVNTFRRYYEGAAERARQCGYHLEEFWLKEKGMTGRRMSEILQTRGVQGLIVSPLPLVPSHGHLSLDWPRFAAVALGRSLWRPRLDRVTTDYVGSVRLVLRELRHRGYRRIGLFMPAHVDERAADSALGMFLVHQRRFGAANFPFLLTRSPTKDVLARWLAKQRPDVVVSLGPYVLPWLRELGYQVPQQMGYADLDLSDLSGRCAGIDQQSESLGATAVDMVLAHLQRNERGLPAQPKLVMIEGVWVDGDTLRR